MCDRPFLRAKKVRFGNSIFCTFLHIQTFRKSLCAFFLKCNFEILHFFCTLAHFERGIVQLHFFVALWKSANVRSYFFVALWKSVIALFVALWKCGIVRSHFLSLFENVGLCDHTFFVFFKCATKCAIAQSLFQKEQMCENCKFWSHTFLHIRKSDDRTFSKCAIAQPWKG